ncbi:nitrate- and nitrite sensing domain-containing protein [Nocardia salmonicida]|uniref:sensor histidine kinase n=1 Tax=Nocardia salmonicida TaxID=53431 RepID=UPI0033DDC2FF
MAVLTNEARTTSRWSGYLAEQIDLLATFVTAVQEERLHSLLALNGHPAAISGLAAHRAKTDSILATLGQMGSEVQSLNPEAVARSRFTEIAARTPVIRQAVDSGQSDVAAVDDFYRTLAGTVGVGLWDLARHMPDSITAAEQMTAAALVETAELHSRAVAIAAATTPQRLDERRVITELVGAYRQYLEPLATRLSAEGRDRLADLTQSAEWRTATDGENALAENGLLAGTHAEWLAAERVVDAELIGLFRDHALHANTFAADAADRSIDRAVWAGIGVAAISISAFVLALLLANRLIARLRLLRTRTLELANNTLPSIIDRLHDGQPVDVDAETVILDSGTDEIGDVAAAFGIAHRTAMTAAASEARTRDGFNKVFLDIAHRSQVVVRRQLDILDIAEAKQDDPEHLELLFQLDHLATRARRNAENLLILGGRQPGRRWREPVALEQIVRSAVSETHDLSRVSAIRLPQVDLLGNLVADLVHLLAELIDNATHFSPPQSVVSINGNLVGRGVVIEVEDQGLGIRFDERERLNGLLREPQDFQEMALAGQRHLGLFVVSRLAKRHAITVNLQESAYGGVKAIVLIPTALFAPDRDPDHTDPGVFSQTVALHSLTGSTGTPTEQVPIQSAIVRPTLPPQPAGRIDDETHSARTRFADKQMMSPLDSASHEDSRRRTPLPRRHKQTHLVPELREADLTPSEVVPQSEEERRPATEVRNSLTSFQVGTRQARAYIPRTLSNE